MSGIRFTFPLGEYPTRQAISDTFLFVAFENLHPVFDAVFQKVQGFEGLKILEVCALAISPKAVCVRYSKKIVAVLGRNPFEESG